jgi:hypothetical protein
MHDAGSSGESASIVPMLFALAGLIFDCALNMNSKPAW